MKVYLASKSPRRQELMKFIFKEFEVYPSLFDEDKLIKGQMAPFQYVMELAKKKACEVMNRLNDECIIISSDTIVCCDDDIFGKPRGKEHAFNMLKRLENRKHEVYTGVCLINTKDERIINFYEKTYVYFDHMTDIEIEEYLHTGEYKDKAGAYGIQGFASKFVKKIEGCYFNVMGFPVNKIYSNLKENNMI